tara:strand:- start:663 stop:1028 length:366 start_codon:yes stop_codon:yes gene_type:complete
MTPLKNNECRASSVVEGDENEPLDLDFGEGESESQEKGKDAPPSSAVSSQGSEGVAGGEEENRDCGTGMKYDDTLIDPASITFSTDASGVGILQGGTLKAVLRYVQPYHHHIAKSRRQQCL